ncbi:DNA cytosine methyltransferase [Lichenicola cladoniae]|uniref:DNA (cytosine-5-)-methyltransferase n=1 Tax=Lichenicola cladoniae TaxID=1484109 RepID=A0A6M8HW05_9PROT|nr:DNA cytosine methyltransferase [Acetobacteraceae bacterium]QKE92490.1 DNA cytosine methyltransferase [Lichenicola cladoniae]
MFPQWELDAAITVVLFAGRGGACDGLEEAGCPVHVANNHNPVALAAHAAVHPHTKHVKGDIFDVDPIQATGGRRVKILWASPDCRDHSVAKGGAPRSARVRSLPWQVLRWMGKMRPTVLMMENVREIRGWGPLIAKRDKATGRVIKMDGSVAAKGERVPVREQQLGRDPKNLGRSFRHLVSSIRKLGYAYEDRDLCCADFGVPTSRRRWFAVARCDGAAIDWPVRTHAPRDQAAALGLEPWVGAHTIIDWSIPMPSIFERKKPLADATHRRIAVGMAKFVLNNANPFLMPITHTGAPRIYDLADPLRTVTTAHRGEMALVAPHVTKFRQNSTGIDVREPLATVTANGHSKRAGCAIPIGLTAAFMAQTGYGERSGQAPRALDIDEPIGTQVAGGAKHALVAAWMAQHNLNAIGVRMDAPVSTLTTVGSQQQIAGAFLAHHRGTSTANDVEAPVPTLTAGGGTHVSCVAAFMTKYYSQGGVSQAANDPLDTLSTKARFGVVTTTIGGTPCVVQDIGMRMLDPMEAARAHELSMPEWIEIDGVRRRLTKTETMFLIGNSVPKRMARLLAQANNVHALDQAPMKAAAE